MAASKSGNTSSADTQSASNSNKPIENSLIKHQGQKWQQFYDFDKMLKQIRVAEKQHYRSSSSSKGESSSSSHNNGKSSSSSSHGSSSSSSKSSSSSSSSSSKSARSIRQVQRLCGNDMHYYGIIPKHTASDVIVCSSCRGSYTKVGFNNHMMIQHPAAWGAASSKLSHTTSNELYNLITNDNSQDCIRDVATATSATGASAAAVTTSNEILGSPSDLSGIMSTSSNASSSSSLSTSTSSNVYTATTTGRHKSSKSSSTTGGSSSSGSSSSRSRSKQSRHSSNNSSNNHATSIGIHTSSSTSANAETTQTQSKSSKKSSSSKDSSTSSSSTSTSSSNKSDTKNNNTPALAVTTATTIPTTTNASSASKHSKDNSKEITTTASLLETTTTTTTMTPTSTNPIALFSSSSNSSCSLPPTPKLSTTLAEVKSPAVVALQELADSSVSSSSIDYERAISNVKTPTQTTKSNHAPSTTTVKANTITASTTSSSSSSSNKEASHIIAPVKEITHFDAQQLSELDQAVSSITDQSVNAEVNINVGKKMATAGKHVIDTATNVMTTAATTTNNMFQIPPTTSNAITELPNKLEQTVVTPALAPSNNMNVVAPPAVMSTTSYVVPQEVVQACDNALPPHNTSDDNSILTFDDVFDSKFINEILSTADTDINFDENELDTASVVQQQQQQQQQLEQNQMYQQQQQVPTAKRMRYDETILASGQQQLPLQPQQQQHGMPGVEITGEFVAYQQQQQTQLQQQQQHQYMPYNVASLDDLKMFEQQQQQQMPTLLQQQQQQQLNEQQQLTSIDAMQLQQLLYQQQTHFDNSGGLLNDATALQQHQQQMQQQYDGSAGVVSAKQLLDMCGASVDMKTNKMLNDFGLSTTNAGGYESVDGVTNSYEHLAANFQLYNVPSLTDDNMEERGAAPLNEEGVTNLMMPQLMNGMQQQQRGCAQQQFVLPGGSAEEQLIYEITDNNQVAVISQQRQQQMLNEFLTQANYEQQKLGGSLDASLDASIMMQQQQQQSQNNENNLTIKDDIDADIQDFDYTLLDMVKSIGSGSSSNLKSIKNEFSTSGGSSTSSSSKSYDDVYLNTHLYAGIPKPLAINCFGLIKLPFAAATTFRKHILNTRKANNSPISLSGGGGINGIVCGGNSTSTTARNATKSMQNYFSNLTAATASNNNASSASTSSNEFSIGSITITNSTVSQQSSQLFAAQQKQQQSNGVGGNSGSSGGIELTFNTNSNGCVSPVSTTSAGGQRSRTKSGNNSTSGGGTAAGGGGATLVRSKSQTGAPVAVITPNNRLPLPPPRPSTAGPVLAQSSKTIFVSSNTGNSNERVKFIKRCMPLVSSSSSNSRGADGSKKPKFSPRQIADLLGGVSSSSSSNNNKSASKSTAEVNGSSSNHEMNNAHAHTNNSSGSSNTNPSTPTHHTSNSDAAEQLKSERVARFYERRRKLYDMARNTRQQQQQQQQQRTQPPQLQHKLLKQQQQLFKMLTDYGQLNAVTTTPPLTPVVGNCKGANGGNNNSSNGSEILRISV